jgi:hypothetical protein
MARMRGGERLEAALRDLAERIGVPATLRVGFLSNSTYPDGTPVAMVAAIQDFGAPRAGIPPRPFFRNMIKDKSPEWPKAIAGLLKDNGYDAEAALKLAGAAIAGQLRQSIRDTNSPPLAPATIRRKGSSKALIDSGHMLNSVDYEVRT